MRKVLDKIKHNWEVLAILGIFVAIIFFLNWVFDNYGPDITLMWLAIIIAAIAAVAALESLRATRESLELTRATQRPFLTYKNFELKLTSDNSATILTVICNTGVYPADSVSVSIEHG